MLVVLKLVSPVTESSQQFDIMLNAIMIDLAHDLTGHSQRDMRTADLDYAASSLVSAVAHLVVEVQFEVEDPTDGSVHYFPLDMLQALSQLPTSLHQAAAAAIGSTGKFS